MDSTSSFSKVRQPFPDAELLKVGGSTCECYRVRLYGKLHFLKRLKPELRTNPQYVAAMEKEFLMGYQLDHPHLVRYAARTDDGILMDYVDGETLNLFIKHHPGYFQKHENADRFLHQLLSVVGYLHSHQIVHLDLKPGNILITRIGHDVKLTDLGYSYADCYTDTTGHTDKYAAPEQLRGEPVDARTDIYAIGRILQTLPCAPKYDHISHRCTAADPSKRFQSVAEMEAAISRKRPHWLTVVLSTAALLAVLLFLWNPFRHAEIPSAQVPAANDSLLVSQEQIPQPPTPLSEQQPALTVTDLDANQQNIPKGELTKTVNMEESSSSAKSYGQTAPSSPAQSIMPTVQATPSQSHSQATPSTPAQSKSSVAGTQSHKAESSAADLASLHRLLDNAIRPIFEEYLGAYKNRDYHHLDKEELKEYTEKHSAYQRACLNKLDELWKTHLHQYDKELFYAEGWKTYDSYDSLTFLPSRLSHK